MMIHLRKKLQIMQFIIWSKVEKPIQLEEEDGRLDETDIDQ